LHIVLLDAAPRSFSVAILAGETAVDIHPGHIYHPKARSCSMSS